MERTMLTNNDHFNHSLIHSLQWRIIAEEKPKSGWFIIEGGLLWGAFPEIKRNPSDTWFVFQFFFFCSFTHALFLIVLMLSCLYFMRWTFFSSFSSYSSPSLISKTCDISQGSSFIVVCVVTWKVWIYFKVLYPIMISFFHRYFQDLWDLSRSSLSNIEY